MSNFLIDYIASANGLNIATSTPTSSSATGSVGDIAWDSDYIYICTATNTWKRLSIATWGATDPNFSSVSLLLHIDGSNGSTTFTDSSSNSLTITANGDAQVSTAQGKFNQSLIVDGTGDSLSITDSNSVMILGTGDLTVEFWFYTSSNSTNLSNFATFFSGGTNALMLRYHNSFNSILVGYENVAYDIDPSPDVLPTENAWNHIAVVRDSTSLRLYMNGSLGGEATGTGGSRNYSAINRIGSDSVGASYDLSGYIDDFRVTKGIARYTGSSYTVPTAAFPNQ